MKKCFVCVVVASMVMVLLTIPAFSQDPQASAKDDQAPVQAPQEAPAQASQTAPAEVVVKTSELSIYGEVQAINAQAASMTVQYYDYDNDKEKALEVALDKDSKLENVKAIDEVKKGDWVDVTYTATGGKNIIRNISVEKGEPVQEENAPADMTEE